MPRVDSHGKQPRGLSGTATCSRNQSSVALRPSAICRSLLTAMVLPSRRRQLSTAYRSHCRVALWMHPSQQEVALHTLPSAARCRQGGKGGFR